MAHDINTCVEEVDSILDASLLKVREEKGRGLEATNGALKAFVAEMRQAVTDDGSRILMPQTDSGIG